MLSSQLPTVRRATAADVDALSASLARAFLDDPVAMWAWRADHLRESALRRFQAIRMRQMLVDEEVWTSSDLQCAALWAPPGRWRQTLREEAALVRCFAHPRLLARMPLVGAGWQGMERKHPKEPPHWYLAVLGTDPASQGRGLGSAVLAPVLEQCDRDGVGAYLESSKERNIDFYARHGFRVLEELRLVRGPRMWKMWREPQFTGATAVRFGSASAPSFTVNSATSITAVAPALSTAVNKLVSLRVTARGRRSRAARARRR